MRRLIALACSIVLVDTIFFAALSPLLPRFTEELDLSKGEAGLLVAMYALGGVLGAIPSGIAATRLGVKATVALGLGLVAVTSVLFGIVSDYWMRERLRPTSAARRRSAASPSSRRRSRCSRSRHRRRPRRSASRSGSCSSP
jgi:predicted MFS family arabinose efflux permease